MKRFFSWCWRLFTCPPIMLFMLVLEAAVLYDFGCGRYGTEGLLIRSAFVWIGLPILIFAFRLQQKWERAGRVRHDGSVIEKFIILINSDRVKMQHFTKVKEKPYQFQIFPSGDAYRFHTLEQMINEAHERLTHEKG